MPAPSAPSASTTGATFFTDPLAEYKSPSREKKESDKKEVQSSINLSHDLFFLFFVLACMSHVMLAEAKTIARAEEAAGGGQARNAATDRLLRQEARINVGP